MAMQYTRQDEWSGSARRAGAGFGMQPRHRQPQSRSENAGDERLARALGWFSIGLGLAEVVAPRGLARLIGIRDRPLLLRAFGLREIAGGVGILAQSRPAGWLWARVAGDAMDLAFLGTALESGRARQGRVAAAIAAVAGVTVLDLLCARQLSRRSDAVAPGAPSERAVEVRKSIAINRAPEEVYRFWHDFQNLPRFMKHLDSVQVTGERRSHWVAKAPAGRTVEWDAEITDDRPNERIAWRSLAGADVANAGSVTFERAPGGRGTTVRVDMRYDPPGGMIGAAIAKLFGEEPRQQVKEDLRSLKQIMETGEIATTEGQPSGRSHRAT